MTTLQQKLKKQGIKEFLEHEEVQERLARAMSNQQKQRFCSALISRVQNNPALQDCQKQSIVAAALIGETLGLSPSETLGQYYIVPFRNRKNGTTTASFQIGYKGYLQLAIRSGQYKRLNVIAIKEGELISYDPIEEEIKVKITEDVFERESKKNIGYFGFFELTNGFKKSIYWTHEKMEMHAKTYSKSYNSTSEHMQFWKKDFEGMALKTLLRQLLTKWGALNDKLEIAEEEDIKTEKQIIEAKEIVETPKFIEEKAEVKVETESEKQLANNEVAEGFYDE
jgi:recombination protein RecT